MHKIIYKNHLSSSLFRHCFFSILLKLAINYDGPSVTLQASGHSFRGSTPVPAPWSVRRRRPSVQLCPPGKQRHRRPSRRSLPWQHDILHLRPRPRRKFFVAQNLGRNNLVVVGVEFPICRDFHLLLFKRLFRKLLSFENGISTSLSTRISHDSWQRRPPFCFSSSKKSIMHQRLAPTGLSQSKTLRNRTKTLLPQGMKRQVNVQDLGVGRVD